MNKWLIPVIICSTSALSAQKAHQNAVIDLWLQGKPVFGVYAPNENARKRSARSWRIC